MGLTPRKRRQRLDSISVIAAQLRQSNDVLAPDLTSSILDQVDATRPFLDGRTRGMLWVGRIAIGCSVAMVGLGIALTHRWAPEAVDIVMSRPAPLSNVVETVKFEAGERLTELRVAVDSASQPSTSAATASVGTGGLLALVSSATPVAAASGSGKPCTFCGPMIPPAMAARLAPAPGSLASTDGPGAVNDGLTAGSGSAWISARLRLAGLASSADGQSPTTVRVGLPVEQPGRLVLDELTPLGIGSSADSALAPK
jgi:hypothetical protein